MRNFFPSLGIGSFLPSEPLYEPPDAGAGSGGSSSSSGGASGADAGAGGVAGAGSGGGNAPSAYRLTDDSLVDFGDGKPVKWSEARSSRFMDRSSYDRGVEFLMQQAKALDAAAGRGRQQPGQQPHQQQPGRANNGHAQTGRDPFEELEGVAVVDGRTLAKLGRQMQQEGFGPIGQLITTLAGRLQTLESQVQKTGQITGTLAEQQTSQEFEGFITKSLSTVPEIKGLGMVDPKSEVVREIAKDIFLSHDQNDKSLMNEFPKMLETRLNELFKLFTKMQGDAVEAAKQKRRQFFQPGGNAKPGGGQAYKHLTGTELAREFFGASDART